ASCFAVLVHVFSFLLLLPRSSPLFPYTTLFRSLHRGTSSATSMPRRDCPGRQPPRIHMVATMHPEIVCSCMSVHCFRKGDLNRRDRKSTRLNSSHVKISYAVFCLKKKKK